MNWTAPTLVAINMDAEIGSYQDDGDPMREPPFTSDGSSAEMSRPGLEFCAFSPQKLQLDRERAPSCELGARSIRLQKSRVRSYPGAQQAPVSPVFLVAFGLRGGS